MADGHGVRSPEWQAGQGDPARKRSGSYSARLTVLLTMLVVALLSVTQASAAGVSHPKLVEVPSSTPTLVDESHKGLGPEVPVPAWAQHRAIHFFMSYGQQQRLSHPSPLSNKLGRVGLCCGGPYKGVPLNYYGGAVQHLPKLYLIFWGSNWNAEPGAAMRSQLIKLYEGLVNNSYQGILTQYSDKAGYVTIKPAILGNYTDTGVTAPSSVVDASIRTEVERAEKANEWPGHSYSDQGGPEDQFIVFPAPGSTYAFSEKFCGYHGVTGNSVYTFVPYVGDEPFFGQCDGYEPNHNVAHISSMVASHEYSESATDPLWEGSSWTDTEGWEIGDICAGAAAATELPNGSWVQPEWSNKDSACVLGDPTTEPAPAPGVAPQTVQNITASSALLAAQVYPGGWETHYHFEWGSTTAYGHSTAEGNAGSEKKWIEVKAEIYSLQWCQTYHFRLVASNGDSTATESDQTFKTLCPPIVKTEAASAVTTLGAVLNGTVNPDTHSTSYYFEYGPTESLGSRIPLTSVEVGSGSAPIAVSQKLTFQKREVKKTYYFRVVASNEVGSYTPYVGEIKTFTTPEAEWHLDGAMLTESLATSWKGKLKLTDTVINQNGMNGGAECEDTAEGPVVPGNTGEITKVTMSKCVAVAPCEASSSTSLEALDLPWHTELVAIEGATHYVLAGSGHGEPEVRMKCKWLGSLLTDECRASALNMTTTNGTSGVTATFITSEKLTCNGRTGSHGILEGTQTIEATKGGKLSAVSATEAAKLSEAEWRLSGAKLTGSLATSWKGKLKLTDTFINQNGMNGGAECEDTAEGPVVPGNTGEITKVTMSKCVAVAPCEASSSTSLEALDLPWHTELVAIEGATRYVLAGSGHGEPEVRMKCKWLGFLLTDECRASALNMTTTNGTSGVTATFITSEKLTCNGRTSPNHGTLEGTQTITASKGGKLETH